MENNLLLQFDAYPFSDVLYYVPFLVYPPGETCALHELDRFSIQKKYIKEGGVRRYLKRAGSKSKSNTIDTNSFEKV